MLLVITGLALPFCSLCLAIRLEHIISERPLREPEVEKESRKKRMKYEAILCGAVPFMWVLIRK